MGWFIVNAADAQWTGHEQAGRWVKFEYPDERFEDYGINIHVLEPGQANGKYHRENLQEDFLVLHGECKVLIEGEERALRQWDFVHCPAGTTHIFVGAGDGPCAILMVGARCREEELFYPVNELAAKYGGSALKDTPSADEAYSDWSPDYPPVEARWPL